LLENKNLSNLILIDETKFASGIGYIAYAK